MMHINLKSLTVGTFLLLITSLSFGASRYWVSSVAGGWSVAGNWSATSGGAGGAGIPAAGDDVFFNGVVGTGTCLITAPVTVTSITVSGYLGIITQGAVATITTTGVFALSSGTFTGSAAAMTLGSFSQNGGVFTTTSGITKITGNADFTSGTFNPNLGIINFNVNNVGPAITITGTPTLNNLNFTSQNATFQINLVNTIIANDVTITIAGGGGIVRLDVATVLTVKGNLLFTGAGGGSYVLTGSINNSTNTGVIKVEKNVTLNATTVNNLHPLYSPTIEFTGTIDQDFTSNVAFGFNMMPSIRVNKPSGKLNLIGTITIVGPNITYVSGTVDPGTSFVWFYQPASGAPIVIAGALTLANMGVALDYAYPGLTVQNNLTVDYLVLNAAAGVKALLVGDITVNYQLTMTGSGSNAIVLNGGTVYVKGDMNLSATSTNLDAFNTSTINICGTGTQTITGTSALGQNVLPHITIDKPSGDVILKNSITLMGNWTYIRGNVDALTNSSSVYMFTNSTSVIPTLDAQGTFSTMTFYDLRVNNAASSPIKLGGALDVDNNFRIGSNTRFDNTASSYPINLGGNFTNDGRFLVSNGIVTFDGTSANQIYNHTNYNGGSEPASVINTLVINKPSGKVTLNSPLEVKSSGQLVMTQGIIGFTGIGQLTVNNDATTTIGNSLSYIDGPLYYNVGFNGTKTINFPIGNGNAWRPLEYTIRHNVITQYQYKAQVVNASASALAYPAPASIERVSGKRYWQVDSTVPIANFVSGSVKLYFDADDEVDNMAKLGVVKATLPSPTTWSNVSGGASSGIPTGSPPYLSGFINSIPFNTTGAPSPFSNIFALANTVAGAGPDNPLPISLTLFKVTGSSNHAIIDWETETEKNNDYFILQRSHDGLEFEELVKIKGAGTKTQKSHYAWTDINPLSGYSYYRLKQVDFDGGSTVSKIIKFETEAVNNNVLVLYPIPVVRSTVYFNQRSSVKILDAAGNLIASYENVDQADLSNFAPGMYYVLDSYGKAHKMPVLK